MAGIKAFVLTAVGGVAGAMAGGPIGMAGGLAVGGGIDFIRAKRHGSTASGSAASAPALPPSADLHAAAKASALLILGSSNSIDLARTTLQQFQTSVGLPPTGVLDPTTRAMLVSATANAGANSAARLPATTMLG